MTLTLKNIPPRLHLRLKAQAQQHKRSLNQEAILCLEQAVSAADNQGRPSLANPPAPISVGAILQPWSSRAEMLGNFLDRQG